MGHVHIHEQPRVWIVVSSRSIVSIGLCCCGWLAGWCKCDEKGRFVHFIICCLISPFNSHFLTDLSPSTYTSHPNILRLTRLLYTHPSSSSYTST